MFELIRKLKDPLYKNSIFLIASSLLGAGTGFVFWVIAARFYSAEDVGLASAIISAMGLLSLLSVLGFDITLVRFVPETKDKNELINTCLTVSALSALLLSSIFLAGLNVWAPSLILLRENTVILLLFIFFTLLMPLVNLQRFGIFVGFRKAEYSFISSVATFMRLLILPVLVTFGALGIVVSYGITAVLAFIFGIYLASKLGYRPVPTVKKRVINDVLHYSFGNYIARVFEGLPTFVLPVMVTNVLGAKANAYFYVAWAISMLLLAIPNNISASLLAEGAHNQKEISRTARRALKFILLLLIPAIVLIYFFGKYILLIFGEEYAKYSLNVLRILALGVIPFAFNVVYVSLKRVKKEIKPVIWVYGGIAATTLVGSYLLMQDIGTIGVGIAWVLGNSIVAGSVGIKIIQKK